MNSGSAPTGPPTATELLSHHIARQALAEAWRDSLVNDPQRRHEEGGWIYMDTMSGDLIVRRAPSGARAQISLGGPPLIPGAIIVGTFHTHPNPTAEGWDGGPGTTDQNSANYTGVPWLIRADDGDYWAGPACRRGGLSGGPCFPP
jgi:hypothetical protein